MTTVIITTSTMNMNIYNNTEQTINPNTELFNNSPQNVNIPTKVCSTCHTIKKIKELRKLAITDDTINKVLTANDTPKTGSGFFYV